VARPADRVWRSRARESASSPRHASLLWGGPSSPLARRIPKNCGSNCRSVENRGRTAVSSPRSALDRRSPASTSLARRSCGYATDDVRPSAAALSTSSGELAPPGRTAHPHDRDLLVRAHVAAVEVWTAVVYAQRVCSQRTRRGGCCVLKSPPRVYCRRGELRGELIRQSSSVRSSRACRGDERTRSTGGVPRFR